MAPLLERGNKRNSAAEHAFLGIPSRTSLLDGAGGVREETKFENTPELKQIFLGISKDS